MAATGFSLLHLSWMQSRHQNGSTFCVVPIIASSDQPLPATFDFWAAGKDCCTSLGESFHCGAANAKTPARGGIRPLGCVDSLAENDAVWVSWFHSEVCLFAFIPVDVPLFLEHCWCSCDIILGRLLNADDAACMQFEVFAPRKAEMWGVTRFPTTKPGSFDMFWQTFFLFHAEFDGFFCRSLVTKEYNYRQAVRFSEVAYHMESVHPLFFEWTENPIKDVSILREEAYGLYFLTNLV